MANSPNPQLSKKEIDALNLNLALGSPTGMVVNIPSGTASQVIENLAEQSVNPLMSAPQRANYRSALTQEIKLHPEAAGIAIKDLSADHKQSNHPSTHALEIKAISEARLPSPQQPPTQGTIIHNPNDDLTKVRVVSNPSDHTCDVTLVNRGGEIRGLEIDDAKLAKIKGFVAKLGTPEAGAWLSSFSNLQKVVKNLPDTVGDTPITMVKSAFEHIDPAKGDEVLRQIKAQVAGLPKHADQACTEVNKLIAKNAHAPAF